MYILFIYSKIYSEKWGVQYAADTYIIKHIQTISRSPDHLEVVLEDGWPFQKELHVHIHRRAPLQHTAGWWQSGMDTGFLLDISDNTPYILRVGRNRGHVIHLKATAEENEMLLIIKILKMFCVSVFDLLTIFGLLFRYAFAFY